MAEEEEEDVEEMSYRERLTRAKKLQDLAAASSENALDAAAHLRQALRYLWDVDEDSPKEAQMLRAAILQASALDLQHQGASGPGTRSGAHNTSGAVHLSAAQAAHVLKQACPKGPGDDFDVAPAFIENLPQCFAEAVGACEFFDAGGLPPLLQLCSRQTAFSLQALHSVHAFSATRSMVPAMCSAGTQDDQCNRDCLWWLRRTVHTDADPSERVLGLKIIANMSDVKELDAKQQDLVQSALRKALLHRVWGGICTPIEAGSSMQLRDQGLIQQLEKLLANLVGDQRISDLELALLLCTCIRNLARDAELRGHLECLLPLLLKVCVIAQSAFGARAPQTQPVLPAANARARADTECCHSVLLAALEALINCMSGSATNRGALLNSSASIVCHFSAVRWGFGLKNLRTPLILTKVEAASEAATCGLVPGDVIVRVGEHVDYGESLLLLQQSLRQGGSAEVEVQRTGVVVLAVLTMGEAACLDDRCDMEIRETAACALGCLSSFYEPGQLALVRSGAVKMLLAALSPETPPAVASAIADAVANCALAPANHPQLVEFGAVSSALGLLARTDAEMRCSGAKVLSLMLRGKLGNKSDPGVEIFLTNGGVAALESCLEQEARCREIEIGGLWLRERGGARIYVQELLDEIYKQ